MPNQPNQHKRAVAVAVVLALLIGGGVLAATQLAGGWNADTAPSTSPSSSSSAPDPSRSPSRSGTDSVARGPEPPVQGAWVGAWVKPEIPTQAGRLSAVADFEAAINRPLAVAHTFHKWIEEFPGAADMELAKQNTV